MLKKELKEERIKILEMLSSGLVNAKEASKLLEAMEEESTSFLAEKKPKKTPFRMLRIFIDSQEGDVVKVQIPIEFAKLLKSKKFSVDLKNKDIDLDSILEMIDQGHVGEIVNINSADGDKVKIVVE